MTIYQWLWFTLAYLACGNVFALTYLLKFRDERRSAWLGLMVLGWVVYLALDVVLTIAGGLGSFSKTLLMRFEKEQTQ